MRPNFLFLVMLLASLSACHPKESANNIPTYIHVDSFNFNPGNYSSYGSASHDIKTVFVSYNNNPVGVFDLPATFPVMANGAGTLEIQPGIAEDGLDGFQSAYPFYTTDTFSFSASPGNTIYRTPVTGYFKTAKVVFTDDFEVGNSFTLFDSSSTDSITITHDADKVFEGKGSGYIAFNKAGSLTEEVQTINPFAITGVTYLEINYRSDIPFTIGLLGDSYNRIYYIGGLNASNGVWKKAYFNLSQFPASFPSSKYFVGFKTVLPTGQASGYLTLDNIKVITF